MPREVCETIEITRAIEVCKETPKSTPNIDCASKLKEIELKEICIDIALQLPREEEWGSTAGRGPRSVDK